MMAYLKMFKVSSKTMMCCAICYVCYFLNSGKVVGYFDELNGGTHHTDCLKYVPLDLQSLICSKCSKFHENVLRGRLAWHLQEKNGTQSVEVSSHTNFWCHTSIKKCERMKNRAAVIHTKDQHIAHLNEKINKLVSSQGVLVDRDISNDLVTMMKECSEAAQKEQSNPIRKIFLGSEAEGSFVRVNMSDVLAPSNH